MLESDVMERAAAQALLDRGVGFQIPAPFFLRLLGKKTAQISVKRLRLGTLLHISQLIPPEQLSAPLPPEGGMKEHEFEDRKKAVEHMSGEAVSVKLPFIRENTKTVCKAVACGLLNSKLKIRLFSGLLGNYLQAACTPDQLQELTLWLFAYGRAESFMTTTKLLQAMRTTAPRNLGPTQEVS